LFIFFLLNVKNIFVLYFILSVKRFLFCLKSALWINIIMFIIINIKKQTEVVLSGRCAFAFLCVGFGSSGPPYFDFIFTSYSSKTLKLKLYIRDVIPVTERVPVSSYSIIKSVWREKNIHLQWINWRKLVVRNINRFSWIKVCRR